MTEQVMRSVLSDLVMIVRCWNKVESMAKKAHLKSHSLPERTSFKEGHKKFSDDDEQFSKHSWRGWYQHLHLHHFSRTSDSDSCWMFDKETSYVTWERKSTFQQELARSNQKTYNLLSWGKYDYACNFYNYFAYFGVIRWLYSCLIQHITTPKDHTNALWVK